MSAIAKRFSMLISFIFFLAALVAVVDYFTGMKFPELVKNLSGEPVEGKEGGSSQKHTPQADPGGLTSPIDIKSIVADGVEVTWRPIADSRLDHYSVDVEAVYPVSYKYNVPRSPQEVIKTSERIYPKSELNKLLEESDREERVEDGQIWRVCVTGMLETPLGVDITSFIIENSESCSEDFVIP